MIHPHSGERLPDMPERPKLELAQVEPALLFPWIKQDIAYHRHILQKGAFREYLDTRANNLNDYMKAQYGDGMPDCVIETFDEVHTKEVTGISLGEYAVRVIRMQPDEAGPYKGRTALGTFKQFGRPIESDKLLVYLEDDQGHLPTLMEGGIHYRYPTVPVEGSEIAFMPTSEQTYKTLKEETEGYIRRMENSSAIAGYFMQLVNRAEDTTQTPETRLVNASKVISRILSLTDPEERSPLDTKLFELVEHMLDLRAPQDIEASRHRLIIGKSGYTTTQGGSFRNVVPSLGNLIGEPNVTQALIFTQGLQAVQIPIPEITRLRLSKPQS